MMRHSDGSIFLEPAQFDAIVRPASFAIRWCSFQLNIVQPAAERVTAELCAFDTRRADERSLVIMAVSVSQREHWQGPPNADPRTIHPHQNERRPRRLFALDASARLGDPSARERHVQPKSGRPRSRRPPEDRERVARRDDPTGVENTLTARHRSSPAGVVRSVSIAGASGSSLRFVDQRFTITYRFFVVRVSCVSEWAVSRQCARDARNAGSGSTSQLA